jgi:hypothetical protein
VIATEKAASLFKEAVVVVEAVEEIGVKHKKQPQRNARAVFYFSLNTSWQTTRL